VEVRLLGPLEVIGDDGQPVTLGGAKERTVLAVLAIHANEPVSADRLADALWGDGPPRTAVKTVQSYVSRLRKVGLAIESTPSGYVLKLADADLDVTAVEAALVDARDATAVGDAERAAERLTDAERRWRGGALPEFAGEPFALPETARLAELRAVVLEERIAADLARGCHAEAVPELEALCTSYPLRERLWALRMLALYRSGRQAEALRAYQDVRRHLSGELGIEPGPDLRALEGAILAQAPELDVPTPRAAGLPTGVVTFLLTDIEGSTAMWDSRPEIMANALARHDAIVADAVFRGGGVLIKSKGEGDATLSVFARTSEAVAAATELHRALVSEAWPGGLTLRVRLALHTGEAYERDGDYYGPALNRAARLRGMASGGQIVVSTAVAELVADRLPADVTLRDLGHHQLRGLARDEHVYELVVDGDSGDGVEELTEAEPEPPTLPLPAAFSSRDFFVNRQAELDSLLSAWRAAARGRRRAVLLAGEPGIGKTRLATELGVRLHAEGALVLHGRCDEEVATPYQPFVEAVRPYVAACPSRLLQTLTGRGAPELARVMPELAEKLPGLPVPVRADPESERYLLFAAMSAFLGQISSRTPTVLILDDLHWAARPTLLMLRHVLRAETPMSMLVVGTYRDTEVDRSNALPEVLADLRRDNAVNRVMVEGLSRAAVGDYVDEAADHRVDERAAELVAALHEGTRGNPFFIREVIAHLAESGQVYQREDGTWTSDVSSVDEMSIPEGVRDVVGQRLGHLSEAAQQALVVGAVIGPSFELAVIEAVPEASDRPDTLLDVLEETMEAGILVEESAGVFAFSHALVRHTLLRTLSSARRMRLHRRIGEAIERLPPMVSRLPALAHHFAEAALDGQAEKAGDYSLQAARNAIARTAFEEAVRLADRGIEVLELSEVEADVVGAELRLIRAEALNFAADGEATTIKEAALAAADAARAAGRPHLLAAAAALYGYWVTIGAVDPRARPLYEDALERVGSDPRLRSQVLTALANYILGGERDPLAAEPLAAEAFALGKKCGDPRATAQAGAILGLCLLGTERSEECIALGDELAAIADATGDDRALHEGLVIRAPAHLEQGDLEGFDADVAGFEGLADRLHWWAPKFFATMLRGTEAVMSGRFGEARARAEQILQTGAQDTNSFNAYAAQLTVLARDEGTLEEFIPLVEAAVAENPTLAFRAVLASSLAETGQIGPAQVHFESLAADDFAAVLPGDTYLVSLALLAEVAATLGDAPRAEALFSRLERASGHLIVAAAGVACIGAADRFLGMLAVTCGRHDEAERLFERALDLEERLGLPPFVARTRLWFARALTARGDTDRARAEASASRLLADELGMAGVSVAASQLSPP
jgi:DNA-binding SARP family transcriptional activator